MPQSDKTDQRMAQKEKDTEHKQREENYSETTSSQFLKEIITKRILSTAWQNKTKDKPLQIMGATITIIHNNLPPASERIAAKANKRW